MVLGKNTLRRTIICLKNQQVQEETTHSDYSTSRMIHWEKNTLGKKWVFGRTEMLRKKQHLEKTINWKKEYNGTLGKKTTYWVNMQDNAQHNVQQHIKKKTVHWEEATPWGKNMLGKYDVFKKTRHWKKNTLGKKTYQETKI